MGHQVIVASPSKGINALTGEGLAESLKNIDFQPIAPEEVALFIARFAISEPANGTVEIAGPVRVLMNEFVEANDAGKSLIANDSNEYSGLAVPTSTLVPEGTGATFENMFSVAGASLLLPFLPMLPKQILLTNFITDLPALAIASDAVDPQQTSSPGKWSMRLIRRFMVVFGLHSSFFDFVTFYVLYYKLHLTGSAFRTGWFLESVISELLILLIVRTQGPFLSSKPSMALLWLTLSALAATVLLPGSFLAKHMGFSLISFKELVWITGILTAYVITADLLKVRFFRADKRAPQQ